MLIATFFCCNSVIINYISSHFCSYSEGIVLSVILPNGIMLSVVMLNVVMPNVVMLNVVMPNVVMLSVVMLSVVMLNAVILSVLAPGSKGQKINMTFQICSKQLLAVNHPRSGGLITD